MKLASPSVSRAEKQRLAILLVLIFGAFFGSLCAGAWLFPERYDWRYRVISNLLSPRDNPRYYWIPSSGVALTGLLLFPFAGYLGRSLAIVSRPVACFCQGAFLLGAVCLICAGLIVPQHTHAILGITRLHEILARTAAAGFASAMLCCWCARPNRSPASFTSRILLTVWWAVTLLPLLGIFLSESLLLVARGHAAWAGRVKDTLRHSVLWHLGFWEWTGAGAFFLFLVAAVFLLPAATSPSAPHA